MGKVFTPTTVYNLTPSIWSSSGEIKVSVVKLCVT